MKKSNKGFTLVELVVVIAIIGVLAAILVPSMLNYVKKSRLKTANSNAKTAYNAVAEYVADQETKGVAPVFTTASAGVTCTANQAPSDTLAALIYQSLSSNGNEAGIAVANNNANINGDSKAFFAQWHKTSQDDMIGQYPEAQTWENWKAGQKITWGTWKSSTVSSGT